MKKLFLVVLLPLVCFAEFGDLYIPADASNPGYDVQGNLLTHPGGHVHNGCEVGIWQTGTKLLDGVELTVGTTSYDLPYVGDEHGCANYELVVGAETFEVAYSGTAWAIHASVAGTSTHAASDTLYPPQTGYPDVTGIAVEIDYDSPWMGSDGVVDPLYYADLIGHTNGVGNLMVKVDCDGNVTDILTYSDGWTGSEWTVLDLWMNIPCTNMASMVAATNASGGNLYYSDGTIILVNP